MRRKPFVERKAALAKLLFRLRDGAFRYVEHVEGHGDRMFAAACDLGLEGLVNNRSPDVGLLARRAKRL